MFIFVFVRLSNNVNATEVVAFPVRRIYKSTAHCMQRFSSLDVVILNICVSSFLRCDYR